MTFREHIRSTQGGYIRVQYNMSDYWALVDILESEGYRWIASGTPTDFCPTNALNYYGRLYMIIDTNDMVIGWNDDSDEEYVVASSFDDIRNGGCSVGDSLTTFLTDLIGGGNGDS